MIKISDAGLATLAKEHANKVIKFVNKKAFTNAEKKYFTDEKIIEILTAKPEELSNYTQIGQSPMSLNNKAMKLAFIGSDSSGKKDGSSFGYNKFSTKDKNGHERKLLENYDAYELAAKLNIKVCPYCNRNYTFTIQSKNGSTRPVFDHFYDKGKYPFLALSFYNLIPSCHICNSSFKCQKPFSTKTHLHPYLDDFNSIARFSFKPLDVAVYQKLINFDYKKLELNFEKAHIAIKDIDFAKAKKNIEDFGLRELYGEHKDIVLELIQKAEMYNDSYIDELMKNYEGTLFKNREDLTRLIFGGYITDEEISDRPLSKLTKDILEQLEII